MTERDLKGMNSLCKDFSGLACIGFFSNQFGMQSNVRDCEMANAMEHVRPGKGFKCCFDLFAKIEVNGANEHPLFTYLKEKLPMPSGPGALDIIKPWAKVYWAPLKRSDIGWNFEKFLIDKNGVPVKRYTSNTPVADIKKDIEALL